VQFLRGILEAFALMLMPVLMPVAIYLCAGFIALAIEFLWGSAKETAIRLLAEFRRPT